jgi:predicted RNase H-like HicB family nuclease
MSPASHAYPATITPDEDGRYVVRFPDLTGAVTDGATLAEALSEASDALSEALAAAIDRWRVFDNSGPGTLRLVAAGIAQGGDTVADPAA